MSNLIGQVLMGQFRVDAFVAAGGMGAVYRVWDLQRNVSLAMKTLHADLSEDTGMYIRFEREARVLKKLAHPHIVPFYGLYSSGEETFILERFVDGPTLKDLLRRRQGRPLQVEEALTILKPLCAALGYAHVRGVVHCDVKPGNVMVDQGYQIYLTDFGIARHAHSTNTVVATSGTAAYMAPEQIRGEAVSAETDVYALGVVLFEMTTGQRPFKISDSGSDSPTPDKDQTVNERIYAAHLHQPPPDPCRINPTLPAAFGQVILKALAKTPTERYPGTQALFLAACEAAGMSETQIPERASFFAAAVQTSTLEHANDALAPPISPRSYSNSEASAETRLAPVGQASIPRKEEMAPPQRLARTNFAWLMLNIFLLVALLAALGGLWVLNSINTQKSLTATAQAHQVLALSITHTVEALEQSAQAVQASATAQAALPQSPTPTTTANATQTVQQAQIQATSAALAATATKLAQQGAQRTPRPSSTPTVQAVRRPAATASRPSASKTPSGPAQVCNLPDVTGIWNGVLSFGGTDTRVRIRFTQKECKVSGMDMTGSLGNAGLDGTISNGQLVLRLLDIFLGCDKPRMLLEVTAQKITGKVTICNGGSLTLTRQP